MWIGLFVVGILCYCSSVTAVLKGTAPKDRGTGKTIRETNKMDGQGILEN